MRKEPFCRAGREGSPARTAVYVCGTTSSMLGPFTLSRPLWLDGPEPYPRAWMLARGHHSRGLAPSGAQRAFELVLGPLDHVIEFLATLCELCHHDGIDGLVVDLCADFRSRRSAGD